MLEFAELFRIFLKHIFFLEGVTCDILPMNLNRATVTPSMFLQSRKNQTTTRRWSNQLLLRYSKMQVNETTKLSQRKYKSHPSNHTSIVTLSGSTDVAMKF